MLTITQKNYLSRLMKYCAYQERCHDEVKEKLRELGASSDDANLVMDELIRQNFLNEERFAKAFAGGKFRQKQWGRKKIILELKRKDISPYNIQKAMQEIDAEDYEKTLVEMAEKKWHSLPAREHRLIRLRKTTNFLLQKGYESSLISEIVNRLK